MKLELNRVLPMADGTEPLCDGKPLSFAVDGGEAVVLTAPKGWGKTAVARCVLGLWPLVEGCVSYDAEPVTADSAAWMRRFAGYVPQRKPADAPDFLKQVEELRKSDRQIIVVDCPQDKDGADGFGLIESVVEDLKSAGKAVLWLREGDGFNLEQI